MNTFSSAVILKEGKNILPNGKETIDIQRMSACYRLISIPEDFEKLNGQTRTLKVEFSSHLTKNQLPPRVIFVLTSEDNSYGVEFRDFEGSPHVTEIFLNHEKTIELKPQQFHFLKEIGYGCSEQSRWEQVSSKFAANIIGYCPIPCLHIPLPNEKEMEVCNDWGSLTCATEVLFQEMNEISAKSCSKLQYKGKVIKEERKMDGFQPIVAYKGLFENNPTVLWLDGNKPSKPPTVKLHYKFEAPETVTLIQEYIVVPFEDLVSIVGGTLSLFVGFAFSDWIFQLIEYCEIIIALAKKYFSKTSKQVSQEQPDVENGPKQGTQDKKSESKAKIHPKVFKKVSERIKKPQDKVKIMNESQSQEKNSKSKLDVEIFLIRE